MDAGNTGFSKDSIFLVTGGAGFIGSNLCEALLGMGHRVVSLDNLSTGKQENAKMFLGDENYTFIKGDIRDFDTCMQACKDVDYVLHQAALGSVPRSIEMPLLYEEVNIKGTLNMMEAARQSGVRKFVYASSSSVYGDSVELPKKEGKEGLLLSPYALTKRTDEEYGRMYKELYGLDTYGLRYFNVFGKRQDPDGPYAAVVPKFIRTLLEGGVPVIYGDGMQSRDFTYVKNVVDANLKACAASGEHAGEAFNIGCGGRETLLGVYRRLCTLLGMDVEPMFGDARAGDIRHSHADITKAVELLGYKPEWDFGKGIAESVAWYREMLQPATQGGMYGRKQTI